MYNMFISIHWRLKNVYVTPGTEKKRMNCDGDELRWEILKTMPDTVFTAAGWSSNLQGDNMYIKR